MYIIRSDQGISILALARLVCQTIGSTYPVELKHDQQGSGKVANRTVRANYYVPDGSAVIRDLSLPQKLVLAEAVFQMAA